VTELISGSESDQHVQYVAVKLFTPCRIRNCFALRFCTTHWPWRSFIPDKFIFPPRRHCRTGSRPTEL